MLDVKQWILVVEDDKDFREILTEQLSSQGYSVISCSKANDAARILRNQSFECVVLDMQLEGGSGKFVIESLFEDKRNLNHTTPILVTSGQLSADLVKTIRGKVSGVLVKPFSVEQLVAKIKSFPKAVPV